MDKLSAKLIELIEKGEAATETYAPVLTEHWLHYVAIKAALSVSAGTLLIFISGCSAGALVWCFKRDDGALEALAPLIIFIMLLTLVLGTIIFSVNLPILLEPAGYLVHQFAT